MTSTSTQNQPIDPLLAMADASRGVFDKLKKSLKQIALYRHNTERYGEYLEPFSQAMLAFLSTNKSLQVKLDAVGYKIGRHIVFEDGASDNNIVYPLWQNGVRMIVWKSGVSSEELLRFFLICMSATDDGRKGREDIVTQLWRAELQNIEYIVVEGFKALPDEDQDEVDIEVDKVVAYLYRQLQSNSNDTLRFARIQASDLDLSLENVEQTRGAIIKGITASAADKEKIQLQKMVVVLFQLLELDTTDDNFEDVAEAFVQVLDAMLLQVNFAAIDQIKSRFPVSVKKPHLSAGQRDIVERCQERFLSRMGESQRIQAIAQILNAGTLKDPEGVRRYLSVLGIDALIPLLEMLEILQLLPNRRLVCDIVADLAANHLDTLTARLNSPSSNLVKDILYIIDKLNPPNKYEILSSVLNHQNSILRLETLAVIGRNDDETCFQTIWKTMTTHPDSLMRAQAARLMPNYPAERAAPMLVAQVNDEKFDKLPENEQKALFSSIVQLRDPTSDAFLRDVFEQKSGLFKRSIDATKMMAIEALEVAPSLSGVQLLHAVAQDKRHSKAVLERAAAAFTNVRARLGAV
jgi:hypothetical protein